MSKKLADMQNLQRQLTAMEGSVIQVRRGVFYSHTVKDEEELSIPKDFQMDINAIVNNSNFLALPSEQQGNVRKILQICEARIVFNNIFADFCLNAPEASFIERVKKLAPIMAKREKTHSTNLVKKVILSQRRDLSNMAKVDAKLHRTILNLLKMAISEQNKEQRLVRFDNLLLKVKEEMACLEENHKYDSFVAKHSSTTSNEDISSDIEASYKEEMELGSLTEIWVSLTTSVIDKKAVKRRLLIEKHLHRRFKDKDGTLTAKPQVNLHDTYFTYLRTEVKPDIAKIQTQLDLIPSSRYKTGEARKKDLSKLSTLKADLKALGDRLDILFDAQGKGVLCPEVQLGQVYDLFQKVISEYKKQAQLIKNYTGQPTLVFKTDSDDDASELKTQADLKATADQAAQAAVESGSSIRDLGGATTDSAPLSSSTSSSSLSAPSSASAATSPPPSLSEPFSASATSLPMASTTSSAAAATSLAASAISTTSVTSVASLVSSSMPASSVSTSTSSSTSSSVSTDVNPELQLKAHQVAAQFTQNDAQKPSTYRDNTETERKDGSVSSSTSSLHFDFSNFASTHGGLGRRHMKTLEDLFDDNNLNEKIPLTDLFNVIEAAHGRPVRSGGSCTRYVMNNVMRDIEVSIPLHSHHRPRSDSRDRMADYLTVMQFRDFFKTTGITKLLGQYRKEQKAAANAAAAAQTQPDLTKQDPKNPVERLPTSHSS